MAPRECCKPVPPLKNPTTASNCVPNLKSVYHVETPIFKTVSHSLFCFRSPSRFVPRSLVALSQTRRSNCL